MGHYLVTGGAGFIGSHLAENLINAHQHVFIIDNLSTGSVTNIPQQATYITDSVLASLPHLKYLTLDGIFHLGAPSSTPMYRENPALVGEAILDFTYLMEHARREKIKVVFASSSSVYNKCPIPWKEDMPLHPTDFYTEGRICWERIAQIYYDQYGTKSIGLRFFSVYGPREEFKKRYANVITQMLWAKLKGESFEVFGDGEQRRDCTFVSDIVEALILAMKSEISCDIFNIGTGKNYSTNEIAHKQGVKIKYVPVPFVNYVDTTLADISKAERVLGFKAKVALDEGLKRLYDWTYSSHPKVMASVVKGRS